MKTITFDKTLFQVVIYFSQYKSTFIVYTMYIHVCKWGTFFLTKNLAAFQKPIFGWGVGEGRNVLVDKQEIVYHTLHEKNQKEANSKSHMIWRLIT